MCKYARRTPDPCKRNVTSALEDVNQILTTSAHSTRSYIHLTSNIEKMADIMDIDTPLDQAITKASQTAGKSTKYHEIYSTTFKTPPYAYAHLQVICPTDTDIILDELTLRQHLTAALRQFLGVTGLGICIDILRVSGPECWLRVPREDLGAFTSAVTAWVGAGSMSGFRICAAGDWLGALVGRYNQTLIWGES